MSVVVLYYDDGMYKIAGDGRVTAGDTIYTDYSPKVYGVDTEDLIYGIVGNCSDVMFLRDAIEKYAHMPMELHKHLNSEEVSKYLSNFEAMYATSDGDIYEISNAVIERGDSKFGVVVMTKIENSELPHFLGSGATELRPLFSTLTSYSRKNVDKAFKQAYKINNSIGGHILHKEILINDDY